MTLYRVTIPKTEQDYAAERGELEDGKEYQDGQVRYCLHHRQMHGVLHPCIYLPEAAKAQVIKGCKELWGPEYEVKFYDFFVDTEPDSPI